MSPYTKPKAYFLAAQLVPCLVLAGCSSLRPVILPTMTLPVMETAIENLPSALAEMPPPTATPLPAPTQPPGPKSSPSPTSVQVMSRLPLPPGGVFLADSTTENPVLVELVKAQARVLAIPTPYTWELIQLPGRELFADVRAHYIMTLIKQAYRVIFDDTGDPDTCLLKMYSGEKMVVVRCLKTPPPPFVIVYFLD